MTRSERMRIFDVLGEVYADEAFTAALGVRGRPGVSPAQLMVVTVSQLTENLTGRRAAQPPQAAASACR